MTITADLGLVGVVPPEGAGGNVSQHLALLRPLRDRCLPEFLAWSIKSPRVHRALVSNGYGGTKSGLGLSEIADLSLTVAPLEEQAKVVDAIEIRTGRNADLLHHIGRQVALLQERKQALITAAVTGQLDVTTARSGLGVDVP